MNCNSVESYNQKKPNRTPSRNLSETAHTADVLPASRRTFSLSITTQEDQYEKR